MSGLTSTILTACVVAGAVFALHEWRSRRPSQVSGVVINSITSRPVPGVLVRPRFPNFAGRGVISDSDGHFVLPVEAPDWTVGTLVDDPKFAGLFGKMIGSSKHSLRQGEQQNGVTLLAIPAAAVAGKILDVRNKPVSRCEVTLFSPWSPYGLLQLIESDQKSALSGEDGSYRFSKVDAGIYYLLARCRDARGLKPAVSWSPTLYPHATSLREAKPIVAKPGERIEGLNFRVSQSRSYSLTGRFVWANGMIPKLRADWGDLQLSPLHLGIGTGQFDAGCRSDLNKGVFSCRDLTPGNYEISMRVNWEEPVQGPDRRRFVEEEGKARVQIDEKPPGTTVLNMHQVIADTERRTNGSSGWLNIDVRGCGGGSYPVEELRVMSEDGQFASTKLRGRGIDKDDWELPPKHYRVLAACKAYWGSYSNDYLMKVLASRGPLVKVTAGNTSKIRVDALTSDDIYRIAMDHLRLGRPNL